MSGARGIPTSSEILAAVVALLDHELLPDLNGVVRFKILVARALLSTIQRELELGPGYARAHALRLTALGHTTDEEFASAIRSGAHDENMSEVILALRKDTIQRLAISNPKHLTSVDRNAQRQRRP
jgi:hypothetical protein